MSYVLNMHAVFTARGYGSAVYVVIVCLSVRLSVTRRYCAKTAKRRITETTPYDSLGTFLMPKILAKFQRGHP